jgi:class 3 adenylate cyclase
MEFVNNIARIVHTSVAVHGGAANKNIGDAFLLVWKVPRGIRSRDLAQLAQAAARDSGSAQGLVGGRAAGGCH